MTRRRSRGYSVVELLVGAALSLVLLSVLTGAVGTGGGVLAALGRRGEVEDTAQLALEALAFDVRRAGFTPAAAVFEALADAQSTRCTVQADLNGDGTVDAGSEETATYVCNVAGRKLSRIVGRQSLPLADTVTSCAFRYLDDTGSTIPIPAGGLSAADRDRVRAIALDLTLVPNGPGAPTSRSTQVALRGRP